MTNEHDPLKLAYIIGTYPLLTTTFIDREIRLLRDLGTQLDVLSIRRPHGPLSAEQEALQQAVIYLLPVAWLAFFWSHLRFAVLKAPAYWGTLFYLLSRPHPSLRTRLKTFLHFCEGVYAAHLLGANSYSQLHAHFIDRAATVALVAGRLLNIPYSVTAHATDIYVDPVLLPEKLQEAKFIATCTGYNEQHLSQLGVGIFNHKLSCIYHGLDVGNYQCNPAGNGHSTNGHSTNGHSMGREPIPENKTLLLAVGQLKEKKGFHFLLEACRLLVDRGYRLACHIVGEGPQRGALEAQIARLELGDVVTLCGALPHTAVIDKYEQAALFVLPAIVDAEGGRDGIPNVILEAMAVGLPVVSTRHSGIPEAVAENVTGLLVPPADTEALAAALARLLDAPEARHQMGENGRQRVREKFDLERNVKRLLAEFQE